MKAVVPAYYGRKPICSYFSGVLHGVHEALVLDQRYPADFDGIVAGAPATTGRPSLAWLDPGSPPPTWTIKASRF